MHSCEREREREKGVCGRLSSASNLSAVISVRKRLGGKRMPRAVRRKESAKENHYHHFCTRETRTFGLRFVARPDHTRTRVCFVLSR
jgi:hypothetical protein